MPRRGTQQRRIAERRLRELAADLAGFARRLCLLAQESLERSASPVLAALYQQARTEIRPEMTFADFADLLAQVAVYCCLLARYSQEEQESLADSQARLGALLGLPLLARNLFAPFRQNGLAGQDELADCVNELVASLAPVDIRAMFGVYQEDWLVSFYELFLGAYAPRQRSQRGVYYTPAPVIAYMIRAIDALLRAAFGYSAGLVGAFQDEQSGLFLCDPACGTGAFLWATLEYMRQAYREAGYAEEWRRDLPTKIVPGLGGCELMLAPYLLARIQLALRLGAMDLPAGEHALPCILLANALNQGSLATLIPPERANLPILLGNPPYAGHSSNHNAWISHLLESYKGSDSALRKPGQGKWLSDDYVQFLRLAQWQIEQAGRGIVAFLTSHSYLDNPTFRGMRLSLLRCFDEIYILDLHGNSKKRELAPRGARDRNIFTIQQGVAIGIFVKRERQRDQQQTRLATVRYADVWGPKETYVPDENGADRLSGGKLGWLASHDLNNTPWEICQPTAPFYLFCPQNNQHRAEYESGWPLPAIFALGGDPAPGIVTCQDEFAISWSAEEAVRKVERLLETADEEEARCLFRLCAQNQWNYATARRELADGAWRERVGSVLYRPFDPRWTVYDRRVSVHLRERVTRHMRAGPNLALVVGRAGQVIDGGDWDIACCSRLPTEFNLYRRGGNYLFPLYLYPEVNQARVANLAPDFIAAACQRLRLRWRPDGQGDLQTTLGPEDLFSYMYALLYSLAYRTRYAAFLKIDFPRIFLPANPDLFFALCRLGQSLSQFHLMEQRLPAIAVWSPAQNEPVEYIRYQEDDQGAGRVCINARQYLSGVPRAAWELTIGGYQVARRWLKDRRGRLLTTDELDRYQQLIAILARTTELMAEIDLSIEHSSGWPL